MASEFQKLVDKYDGAVRAIIEHWGKYISARNSLDVGLQVYWLKEMVNHFNTMVTLNSQAERRAGRSIRVHDYNYNLIKPILTAETERHGIDNEINLL